MINKILSHFKAGKSNKDNLNTNFIAENSYSRNVSSCDIGVIGLGVMGENLALNFANHGYKVCVYNRTEDKTNKFIEGIAKNHVELRKIQGSKSLAEFCTNLKSPKKILLMVKAGSPVDDVIESLISYLDSGDIIIDGGNSYYKDTERRFERLKEKRIHYVGCGISGGDQGALNGPSIMPGGSEDAWPSIKDILQSISAKYEKEPCCEWIGTGGSGHFVKMVHNGIEYADMQLIAEIYSILKYQGYTNPEIAKIFSKWNKGILSSYLIEITSKIFAQKDIVASISSESNLAHKAVLKKKIITEDSTYLIDSILDVANQKGTGIWTSKESLDLENPTTLITEAVFARQLSAMKEERVSASKIYPFKKNSSKKSPILRITSKDITLVDLEKALYAAKIIAYAQGFSLIQKADIQKNWHLNYINIAKVWRAGCIIRSEFLNDIANAYDFNPELKNLLVDNFFSAKLKSCDASLRKVICFTTVSGIPMPALSSALSYFDGYKSENSSANLIQAQRDFFGAHTFERIDEERGVFFHGNWESDGSTKK